MAELTAASLLDPPEPVELAAIDDMPLRRQIFATLLARKRADLTAPELGADPEFDRLLREEKWPGDPLFLMMAGLVAGTVGVKNALALTRTDLATTIAQRELDRIGAIAAGAGADSGHRRHPGFLARHMAVLATLTQGLSPADARSLIEEEAKRLGSAADIGDTVAALRDGLPGAGNEPQIAPVLPDIVGMAVELTGTAGVDNGRVHYLIFRPFRCDSNVDPQRPPGHCVNGAHPIPLNLPLIINVYHYR